ncbi:MAG: ABC transporter ATP-binding protein [Treponema sp.]|nr:ABC transporter ATP-binding protein [Candidatus Treponema caballi]
MVKLDDVTKHYKDFTLQCSLEVQPGRITGLIGENGAGKSTTFKAILGLIRADGGTISVFGKDAASLTNADRADIGVVLSNSGYSEWLCVKDIIPIQAALYKNFDRQRFTDMCTKFALPLDKQIKEFSTGMKAKLKCICAITHGARLLILDEPTAGLDVVAREDVLDMLRSYMEEDAERAILISSHISSDLESLCDDFYMIHDGAIVLHEETDTLLSSYGILKMDEAQYEKLDKQYILKTRKEKYSIECLTNQRQFYQENFPDITIEKSSIDELIMMVIKGE